MVPTIANRGPRSAIIRIAASRECMSAHLTSGDTLGDGCPNGVHDLVVVHAGLPGEIAQVGLVFSGLPVDLPCGEDSGATVADRLAAEVGTADVAALVAVDAQPGHVGPVVDVDA